MCHWQLEIRIRKSNEMVNGFVESQGQTQHHHHRDKKSLIIDIAIPAVAGICLAWHYPGIDTAEAGWDLSYYYFIVSSCLWSNNPATSTQFDCRHKAPEHHSDTASRQRNQLANPLKCAPRISIDTLTAARMTPARSWIAALRYSASASWYLNTERNLYILYDLLNLYKAGRI